jgi:hypothetical protein
MADTLCRLRDMAEDAPAQLDLRQAKLYRLSEGIDWRPARHEQEACITLRQSLLPLA